MVGRFLKIFLQNAYLFVSFDFRKKNEFLSTPNIYNI